MVSPSVAAHELWAEAQVYASPSAADGPWASGPTPDGKGEFTYLDGPDTAVPAPPPTQPDPRFYGTDAKPNIVDKAEGMIKDAF